MQIAYPRDVQSCKHALLVSPVAARQGDKCHDRRHTAKRVRLASLTLLSPPCQSPAGTYSQSMRRHPHGRLLEQREVLALPYHGRVDAVVPARMVEEYPLLNRPGPHLPILSEMNCSLSKPIRLPRG